MTRRQRKGYAILYPPKVVYIAIALAILTAFLTYFSIASAEEIYLPSVLNRASDGSNPTATTTPPTSDPTATFTPTATAVVCQPGTSQLPEGCVTSTPISTATSTPTNTAMATATNTRTNTPIPTATTTPRPTKEWMFERIEIEEDRVKVVIRVYSSTSLAIILDNHEKASRMEFDLPYLLYFFEDVPPGAHEVRINDRYHGYEEVITFTVPATESQ